MRIAVSPRSCPAFSLSIHLNTSASSFPHWWRLRREVEEWSMMDIVVRHSDIETSRLRCGSTPLAPRDGTQFLDEIVCTRRLPNRHEISRRPTPWEIDSIRLTENLGSSPRVFGIWAILAHRVFMGKSDTLI